MSSEIDPVYDSDDSDAQGPENTIGNIPLSFYDRYVVAASALDLSRELIVLFI